MRGFKAKALRRLAMNITGQEMAVDGYKFQDPSVQRHNKVLANADGGMLPYIVTGTIVFVGHARRLYKTMKRELR